MSQAGLLAFLSLSSFMYPMSSVGRYGVFGTLSHRETDMKDKEKTDRPGKALVRIMSSRECLACRHDTSDSVNFTLW